MFIMQIKFDFPVALCGFHKQRTVVVYTQGINKIKKTIDAVSFSL